MARIACLLTLLVGALVCLLPVSPAQAQRERVFVASYGSDTNPCTFGSPCKTFQQAINVVADHGEVSAIDSAGFGPIAIAHSVTITSPPGVEAGVAPTLNLPSVQINAGPTDVVVLRGLSLEGATVGRYGIAFNSGAGLEVVDCLVRNFASDGILIAATSGATITISNTKVLDNGGPGIDFEPGNGTGFNPMLVNMDHLTVNANNFGIYMHSAFEFSSVWGVLTNSSVDGNVSNGITVIEDNTAALASLTVRDTSVSNMYRNSSPGPAITVSGQFAQVNISRVLFQNDATMVQILNTGQANSYGNNDGQTSSVTGGSLNLLPQQ